MADNERRALIGNEITYVVEEEAAKPTHQGSINGRCRTTQESERVIAEMGHSGVGMVEVGEHDDPVVRESVWDKVVLDESCK